VPILRGFAKSGIVNRFYHHAGKRLIIPKTGITKINPESVAYFWRLESDRQLTSFHQHSTTNSPSKNYVLPPVFAKNPCKKAKPASQKIIQK
jgi:hypothetical protein